MEENVKILQTRVKLYKDILNIDYTLIYNLREIAETVCQDIIWAKQGESTEDNNILVLNKEQFNLLQDLIYTAKSTDLMSQNTSDYLKGLVKERKIKKEILDIL